MIKVVNGLFLTKLQSQILTRKSRDRINPDGAF